ncbi:MAG: FRG domain-containing protein [Bacteroidota bacterium]
MKIEDTTNLQVKKRMAEVILTEVGISDKLLSMILLSDILEIRSDVDGNVDPYSISMRLYDFFAEHVSPRLQPFIETQANTLDYLSIWQKAIYFEQQVIDTKASFDQLYSEWKDSKEMVFRGQSEAKWRLYNTLQRHCIWNNIKTESEEYGIIIKDAVRNGRKEHGAKILRYTKSVGLETTNDMALLSYLQHNEQPTPLLDWSHRVQIALYFATQGINTQSSFLSFNDIDDYFSVYHMNKVDLTKGSISFLLTNGHDSNAKLNDDEFKARISEAAGISLAAAEKLVKPLRKKMASKDARRRVEGKMVSVERMMKIPLIYLGEEHIGKVSRFGMYNNRNIVNQAGAFIWNHSSFKPIEVIAKEQYEKNRKEGTPIEHRLCGCINIHKSLAGYIRTRLEKDGITRKFIYPMWKQKVADVSL